MLNTYMDFDAAHDAWMLNKQYIGHGYCLYRCAHRRSSGGRCKNKLLHSMLYCRFHTKTQALLGQTDVAVLQQGHHPIARRAMKTSCKTLHRSR